MTVTPAAFLGARRPMCAVRAYRPDDRLAIRRICCDTGYFGQPIDCVIADRELFADLFVDPYLHYEPAMACVVELQGGVVGYMLGSTRAGFDYLLVWAGARAVLRACWRHLRGDYRGHPYNGRFLRWLLTRSYLERPRRPPSVAHMHFNLDRAVRGYGLGPVLWRRFETALAERGIREYHVEFWSSPRHRRERAYGRYGLREYDRRASTLFDGLMTGPVWIICMRKQVDVPALTDPDRCGEPVARWRLAGSLLSRIQRRI